ncbi:holo-ACP synthase [Mycoplasmopsis columbinasalis]|uniref:Holo-[acyl-carrier protein]synthase n=1 Tax=Mycoplasmopsis columbinasalis TaxID=114880 RepID=A0A449BAA6_9BACT|nr:4'-phosphopantetheinyl transferase superfamily protein [Mycoplasmopsis columbinasalis]VEU78133.1 Holo-[acyl-carrier protein]synthase [Mycoplasmopsis columbinasalis]
MIGVDIVRISRFRNKTREFAARILSESELEFYDQTAEKTQVLASLWAIKEAIFKADNSYNEFSKISVNRQANQWMHPDFWLTLSHEDDLVVAVAFKKSKENYGNWN